MEVLLELKNHFITVDRPFTEGTVEVFGQNFSGKGVQKAVLYITALGVYEANINGKKVGNMMFAPGYTYYPKHLNVQTYDVTDMLTNDNELKVYLGQGWYCGRFTCDNTAQIYGQNPAVAWTLVVRQKNGIIRTYKSDDSDVQSIHSPYIYAGMYDGERYVAEGGQDEALLEPLAPVSYEGPLPEKFEETIGQVVIQEEMKIIDILTDHEVTILDFGQNFAGIVEIDPTFMIGDQLRIRHGELLSPDGSLYTTNLRKAKAEIHYTKGTSTEKYRPKFTYMGFRYMELSGVPYQEGLIKAYAIHNEMASTGSFKCENELVNQLYSNQLWGQKSNYVEVPTDCPQRDERMGYTGDGHVFAMTGAYNYDTEIFWKKFLKDIRFSQSDNTEGYVGPTIPATGPAGIGFLSMLGWGNCDTIVPEMLYWQYGTDAYLRDQYESMKLFVECEIRKMGDSNLWLGVNLGDWLMMGKDVAWMAQHNNPVSNAFIVNDLRIMAWVARYLGLQDDYDRYSDHHDKVQKAYMDMFVQEDGMMTDDYQGAYIMALQHVIEKGPKWDLVFSKLVENIHTNGMQTGFFATEYILPILVEGGEHELAYDLLLQEGCPGWMYQIKQGATTTWERWDALREDGTVNETKMSDDNMVSFNHYAFGSVGRFYYQHILGITPIEPGYKKVKIAPIVDKRLGKVQGSYLSRAGLIEVAWEIKDQIIDYVIRIPNDGEIILADGLIREVQAGTHYLQIPLTGEV